MITNRFVALLTLSCLTGCGSGDGLSRVEAWGIITAAGKPLPGTEITLAPMGETKGFGAQAFSSADGTFKLADARGEKRGIVPGEYKVLLHRVVKKDGTPFSQPPEPHEFAIETLSMKLAGPESTLKLTIPPSGGEVKIDVPAVFLKTK